LGKQNQNNIQKHKDENTSITVIKIKDQDDSTPWFTYVGFAFIAGGLILAAANLKLKSGSKETEVILTKKEQEVVDAITQGKTNKEIAQAMFVSLNTVKTHTSNIYSKVGVNSRSQLIEKIKKQRY